MSSVATVKSPFGDDETEDLKKTIKSHFLLIHTVADVRRLFSYLNQS